MEFKTKGSRKMGRLRKYWREQAHVPKNNRRCYQRGGDQHVTGDIQKQFFPTLSEQSYAIRHVGKHRLFLVRYATRGKTLLFASPGSMKECLGPVMQVTIYYITLCIGLHFLESQTELQSVGRNVSKEIICKCWFGFYRSCT